MPDEYYRPSGAEDFNGPEILIDPVAMKKLGHKVGEPVQLWELAAGSGSLSKEADGRGVTHLPPVDYRWGSHIGRLKDQVPIVFAFLVYTF